MKCPISSPFWIRFSVGCAYIETKCPKEMGSCTRIIPAGDKIIRNISCLPHVRLRRDCTFDSAACAKDRHFTHTSMILSRYGEGVITNDTKWIHAPLQPQCLLEPSLTTECPAPEIYSLRIRIRGYAVEVDHPSPRFFWSVWLSGYAVDLNFEQ